MTASVTYSACSFPQLLRVLYRRLRSLPAGVVWGRNVARGCVHRHDGRIGLGVCSVGIVPLRLPSGQVAVEVSLVAPRQPTETTASVRTCLSHSCTSDGA